jgi:exopolysaccharide biosynthesis polyprenyl glycosylphosphotransferase
VSALPQKLPDKIEPAIAEQDVNNGVWGNGHGPQPIRKVPSALAADVASSAAPMEALPPIKSFLFPNIHPGIRVGELARDIALVSLNSALVLAIAVVTRGYRWPHSGSIALQEVWVRGTMAALLVYGAVTVLACQNFGLYRFQPSSRRRDQLAAVCKASLLATAVLVVPWWLAQAPFATGIVLGCTAILNFAGLSWLRIREQQTLARRAAVGRDTRRVLIVGAGPLGQQLALALKQRPELQYTVCGFLDEQWRGPKVLGKISDLVNIARAEFVDEVIIALPYSQRELVEDAAIQARANRLDVKLLPDIYEAFMGGACGKFISSVPVLQLHREPIPALALRVKRVMDVLLSAAGLIVSAPLILLIALAIKLDSPGPVFYSAIRVGKKGRRFRFHKFRSMVVNADALKDSLRALNKRQGPFFKVANDPRITRIGRILRKSSLDELPQLWNVLMGDMSLVGPRPHPEDDFRRYTLEHLRRLDVKPGLTGLWQVSARQDPSFETNMVLDLEYIENWTPWMDLKIMLATFPAVVKGNGE